jgi:hypothetical protein
MARDHSAWGTANQSVRQGTSGHWLSAHGKTDCNTTIPIAEMVGFF